MVTRMTKTNNNEMCIEIYSQSSFHSFTLTHALLANKNNTHKVLERSAEKGASERQRLLLLQSMWLWGFEMKTIDRDSLNKK